MSFELLGRKLGMTQLFNDAGDRVPVTVVEAGPCVVVQKKTEKSDGYSALQLGFEERKEKHTSKAQAGHFATNGISPRRHLFEIRMSADEVDGIELGQEIGVGEAFAETPKVDVIGTTKGRGFTGVIKRHHFGRSKMTHGTHEFFRHAGALSGGTYPGRIVKGKKMAGHHGAARRTQVGLVLEKVDAEKNLLFIRGAVPGHRSGLVRVRASTR